MKTFSIEVPDFVDEVSFKQWARRAIVDLEFLARDRQEIIDAFNSDAALAEYLKGFSWDGHKIRDHSVVRARVYNNKVYNSHLELLPWKLRIEFGSDPRRPVLMRGSKAAMAMRYTKKSAVANQIAKRYMQRIKYCCIDAVDFYNWKASLQDRLEKKGWYVHYNGLEIGSYWPGRFKDQIIFNGKWRDINDPECRAFVERVNKRIFAEYEKNSARDQWLHHVVETPEQREEKRAKYERQITEKRKKRAKQIAALELMNELQTGKDQ